MKTDRIGEQYNITLEIIKSANARPFLTAIATGGGCDYIARELQGGRVLVLGCQEDASSPDRLDEPSTVTLYFEESWSESFIVFVFDTAAEAMDFMAAFQSADFASLLCDEDEKALRDAAALLRTVPGGHQHLCDTLERLASSWKGAQS